MKSYRRGGSQTRPDIKAVMFAGGSQTRPYRLAWCLSVLVFIPLLSFAGPTVVFMTDFGTTDDSVAICKGVMLSIEPDLRIVDITHQVTPFSIADASRFLYGTTPYYPAGTVFLVVVDPGVGSQRKPIVVKSGKGQYFVVPDNGLVGPVLQRDGFAGAREITNASWMIGSALSSTFHGRDIFSPVAAHLAHGQSWAEVGPRLNDVARLVPLAATVEPDGIHGEIIGLDGPYGNLVTNIAADQFRKLQYPMGKTVALEIGNRQLALPFVKTFSDVPLKSPLLYIDSRGRVALAINQGNFAETYEILVPASILIKLPSPETIK